MKVSTETKYGGSAKENRDGFKLALSADVSDDQLAALAAIGLASLGYRGGASVINKALGVESNSETEFSDESAEKIASALGDWASKGAGFKADGDNANALGSGFTLSASVSRHEHGTAGSEPGVMAKAMWEKIKASSQQELLGLDSNATDEDGIAAAREFLGTLRPQKAKKS